MSGTRWHTGEPLATCQTGRLCRTAGGQAAVEACCQVALQHQACLTM